MAHVHSKSGSIGILTTGLDVSDFELHRELNSIWAQLHEEQEDNAALIKARDAKIKENMELKKQTEELKRGQQTTMPPQISPPREMSLVWDQQVEETPQSPEQVGTSAAATPTDTQRTYTPIQKYQWLITKEYFSDLEERVRKMYMYKREMFELSKLIPKEHFPKSMVEMYKAQLREKIEKDWAEYELMYL